MILTKAQPIVNLDLDFLKIILSVVQSILSLTEMILSVVQLILSVTAECSGNYLLDHLLGAKIH